MIHTKVLNSHLKGVNFDMEPNEISSPSGIAAAKVAPKIMRFCPKSRHKDNICSIYILTSFREFFSFLEALKGIVDKMIFCKKIPAHAEALSSAWNGKAVLFKQKKLCKIIFVSDRL